MKKTLVWIPVLAAMMAGCDQRDDLFPGNFPGAEQGDWGDSGNTVEGGGVTTPEAKEDDVWANSTFARTITITFSDETGATVSGDGNGVVRTDGNKVTVDNSAVDETVKYVLCGSTANGYFKVYGANRQAIVLNGVSITNPSGAAINNQSKKRCFLAVYGTNSLSDGASATYDSGEEDMKAVLFSEGQLIFCGDGQLTVEALNAAGKSAVTTDDYIYISETPVLKVVSGDKAGHGLRGKDYVRIAGGTVNVATKAAMKKGINSDGYVLVEGGNTTVNVSGGTAWDDEEQEYTGSAGVKADNFFGMTGGTLTVTNSGNGGKGIRAGNYEYYAENNSLNDSYVNGGTLTVTVTGSDSNDVSAKAIRIGFKEGSGRSYLYGGDFVMNGGTVVATCSRNEALEVKGKLTVNGGDLYVTSTGDDAINAQGELNVTGGYIHAVSSANDAIDTNCDMKLSGGFVCGICTSGAPEVGLDANTEGGCKLYIESGATVVAYGGLESGYSAAQDVYSMSCSAGNWNALASDSGFIAAFKLPSNISSVAVSAPSLSKGYTGVSVGETRCNGMWAADGISGGSAVSLSTYGGNQGGPGGGGGYPGGGGRPGWPW